MKTKSKRFQYTMLFNYSENIYQTESIEQAHLFDEIRDRR